MTRARPCKYSVILGPLTLCAYETNDPSELDVRVVRRAANASSFDQALIIRPGTVLKLVKRASAFFVKVAAFVPRMHYNGRPIAGGIVRLERPMRHTSHLPSAPK